MWEARDTEGTAPGQWISIKTPKNKAPAMVHAATPAEMELLIQTTIQEEEAIPVEAGVKNAAGKYKGLMWPRTYAVEYPAAPLLAKYALD
eukprot:8636669-Ditylum_brightwellii.AAC.1